MGSHSVTCYPTQAKAPALTPGSVCTTFIWRSACRFERENGLLGRRRGQGGCGFKQIRWDRYIHCLCHLQPVIRWSSNTAADRQRHSLLYCVSIRVYFKIFLDSTNGEAAEGFEGRSPAGSWVGPLVELWGLFIVTYLSFYAPIKWEERYY